MLVFLSSLSLSGRQAFHRGRFVDEPGQPKHAARGHGIARSPTTPCVATGVVLRFSINEPKLAQVTYIFGKNLCFRSWWLPCCPAGAVRHARGYLKVWDHSEHRGRAGSRHVAGTHALCPAACRLPCTWPWPCTCQLQCSLLHASGTHPSRMSTVSVRIIPGRSHSHSTSARSESSEPFPETKLPAFHFASSSSIKPHQVHPRGGVPPS